VINKQKKGASNLMSMILHGDDFIFVRCIQCKETYAIKRNTTRRLLRDYCTEQCAIHSGIDAQEAHRQFQEEYVIPDYIQRSLDQLAEIDVIMLHRGGSPLRDDLYTSLLIQKAGLVEFLTRERPGEYPFRLFDSEGCPRYELRPKNRFPFLPIEEGDR
jgi:hypothetical protein